MAKRAIDWASEALALPGARKAGLANAAFAPELARLGTSAPTGDDWLHELKWDGYRLVATMVRGSTRLWSRNAIEWTAKQPLVAAAIERLGVENLAVDGELIAGSGSQADFNLLQMVLSGERRGTLALVLFDLLHLEGVDVSRAPLLERKALLQRLLAKPPKGLAYSSHVVGSGDKVFEAAASKGFEGIISKRVTSPYRGGRSDDWRKTKHLPTDEFAVVGFNPPKGSRTGFGSLLLAKPHKEHGWVYAGRVGTGFTNEMIRQLTKQLSGAGPKPTVHIIGDRAALRGAQWFEPRFVVEVNLRGTGNSGVLRQPSLKAVRLDKKPGDLRDSDRS